MRPFLLPSHWFQSRYSPIFPNPSESDFTPNRTLVSSRPHTILYGNSPSFRFFYYYWDSRKYGALHLYIAEDTHYHSLKISSFISSIGKRAKFLCAPAMIGYLMPIISHFLKLRPSHSCKCSGNVLVILIYIRTTDPECFPENLSFPVGEQRSV